MPLNNNMHPKSYLLLNKIFAGVILAIFLYSACYSPDNDTYPMRCIHEQVLGKPCPTCGMSRAFSALVRLQFDKANKLHSNALAIFLFFFIQLVLRIAAILLVKKTVTPIKSIIYIDIAVSTGLFLITFNQLISSTFVTLKHLLVMGMLS